MRFGAHVGSADPAGEARARAAEVVQVFLSSPQMWRPPRHKPAAWVDALAAESLPWYAHAPYLVNLASATPETRERSVVALQRTLEVAAAAGASGVVVHAGHAGSGVGAQEAVDRFVHGARQLRSTVPLLVENTATGASSLGRDVAVWESLFTALDAAGLDVPHGACLDTCHLWCGADWFAPSAEEVRELAGRFVGVSERGLVHLNGARDPAGAGRDRHANLTSGLLDEEALLAMLDVAAERGWEDVVVETPGGGEGQAADLAWVRARR